MSMCVWVCTSQTNLKICLSCMTLNFDYQCTIDKVEMLWAFAVIIMRVVWGLYLYYTAQWQLRRKDLFNYLYWKSISLAFPRLSPLLKSFPHVRAREHKPDNGGVGTATCFYQTKARALFSKRKDPTQVTLIMALLPLLLCVCVCVYAYVCVCTFNSCGDLGGHPAHQALF